MRAELNGDGGVIELIPDSVTEMTALKVFAARFGLQARDDGSNRFVLHRLKGTGVRRGRPVCGDCHSLNCEPYPDEYYETAPAAPSAPAQ